jgi:hypothetical protein
MPRLAYNPSRRQFEKPAPTHTRFGHFVYWCSTRRHLPCYRFAGCHQWGLQSRRQKLQIDLQLSAENGRASSRPSASSAWVATEGRKVVQDRLFRTATAEGTFSATKLDKTHLCNKFGCNFHNCVIFYIEREIANKFSVEETIETFDLGARKTDFNLIEM